MLFVIPDRRTPARRQVLDDRPAAVHRQDARRRAGRERAANGLVQAQGRGAVGAPDHEKVTVVARCYRRFDLGHCGLEREHGARTRKLRAALG